MCSRFRGSVLDKYLVVYCRCQLKLLWHSSELSDHFLIAITIYTNQDKRIKSSQPHHQANSIKPNSTCRFIKPNKQGFRCCYQSCSTRYSYRPVVSGELVPPARDALLRGKWSARALGKIRGPTALIAALMKLAGADLFIMSAISRWMVIHKVHGV